MKSEDKNIKASHRIPIKNVEIHQPAKSEVYNPRDQIYVRKVKGVFQKLRQKILSFWHYLRCYLGYNTTAIKLFYLILANNVLRYGVSRFGHKI